jgi:hypothetical protein
MGFVTGVAIFFQPGITKYISHKKTASMFMIFGFGIPFYLS